MQNVKSIDNQLVKCTVVQMWFKSFGNNFHVFGTKTDLDSLWWDLRKLAQTRIQRYKKWRKPPRVYYLFSGQKKRIKAASSESVSTQFLHPINARIGDNTYQYSQYGISSTLGYTIPVPVTLIFFWPVSFLCFSSYQYRGFQTFPNNANYLERLRNLFYSISFLLLLLRIRFFLLTLQQS